MEEEIRNVRLDHGVLKRKEYIGSEDRGRYIKPIYINTNTSTPQASVISPTLFSITINIYLHFAVYMGRSLFANDGAVLKKDVEMLNI